MSVRLWLAPAAIWLALAACGDDAGRGIPDEVAGLLAERVAAVRAAAAEDRERARVELGVLREEVATYAEQGDLSDAAADRILGAADAVEVALAEPPAAAPTTTPPPSVSTTAAPGDADPPADQQQRPDEPEAREDETSREEQKKLEERQREEQKKLEEEQRKRQEEEREEERGEQEEGDDDEG